MNIGVAQIEAQRSIDENIQHIVEYIDKASERNLNLLCFPECSITGYVEILEHGVSSLNDNERLKSGLSSLHEYAIKKGMDVIVGNVLFDKRAAFNVASVLLRDGSRMYYKKNNLTASERRCFKEGTEILVFESHGLRFGILICRDQNYPLLAMKYKYRDIHALFMLAAHYYEPDEAKKKRDKNRALPIARAVENGFYVCKANAVGRKGKYVNLGGSLIVSPKGEVLAEADESSEAILGFEVPE